MGKMHTYKAFGLVFKSEFEITEFLSSAGGPDVEIVLGKTPERLSQVKKQGVKYQASKDEFLLTVDRIARYYVVNGNKITVQLFKDKPDKEVRLFLLGSAFGALFVQRGLLPIHGSAIRFGNTATIFTGLSGVGKSTIAAHFVHEGFQALADDISVINQELKVLPGFPSLKIWDDVLKKLNVHNKLLNQIRPNIQKFQLPVSDNYCTQPLALKSVILLNVKNTPGFEIEELTGIKKFNVVKNNTYRYRFVQGLDQQQEHFQILNKLLPQINVYKVSRPQTPLAIKEFGDFLLNNIKING